MSGGLARVLFRLSLLALGSALILAWLGWSVLQELETQRDRLGSWLLETFRGGKALAITFEHLAETAVVLAIVLLICSLLSRMWSRRLTPKT